MASGLMTIYAPGTFASLRRRFEVTDRKYSKVRLFRAQKVPRNPAARFSSRDGGYLVKTIKVSSGVFACVWGRWRDIRVITTPLRKTHMKRCSHNRSVPVLTLTPTNRRRKMKPVTSAPFSRGIINTCLNTPTTASSRAFSVCTK
mmetsp:Transcript_43393/g.52613  ORF Transcript_43393/g.52613 Transcript_43393/m.52613 type:complete len:145 (+) Transcript_43393:782-1216(+)